jgi:Uma2 family endonuclease
MVVVKQKLYTNEEFLAFAQLPENAEKRLELIDGVVYEMPPSSRKNTVTAVRVSAFIFRFVDENKLGYVTGADGGFDLRPGTVRQPDVAFIAKERVSSLEGVTFSGAPDLVVEVISPSESSRDVLDKVRLYLETGAHIVWAMYPEVQIVDAYRLNENGSLIVDTFGIDDVLDGGSVLPGFKLAVKDISPPE